MAYEVTKTIGGRAYRYRVESVVDQATGKRRNRWTYLGRAGGAPARRAPAAKRGQARERLLDALVRLLAQRDFAAITADAVATEAGLAHGTFYRHFRDKRDALLAAFERLRERRGPVMAALRDDVATVDEARAGLREWVGAILRGQADEPALLRAYYGLATRDAEIGRERRERRAGIVRRIAEHLRALTVRGLATLHDPDATAAALFAMVDGFFRDALFDGAVLDEPKIAAAQDVTERAVFGEIARRTPA